MHFRSQRLWLAPILALLLAPALAVAADKLEPGQEAPGIDVEKWYNGDFDGIQEESVYLIAFMKVSDGKTAAACEQMSEFLARFSWTGIKVALIAEEESGPVERFVKKMGRDLTFPVATDRRGSTKRAWVTKAKAPVPSVFIVDRKKKIQYIGMPGDAEFTTILGAVINGRFDARLYKKLSPLIQEVESARKIKNWRMAFKTIDDVVQEEPHIFAFLNLQRFEMMIVDKGDKEGAYEFARKLITDYADDGPFLGALAAKIATDPLMEPEDRDFEVAMLAATTAAEQLSPQDPGKYSVPALVHFSAGRTDDAIRLQKRAYFVAHPKDKPAAKRVLEQYREANRRQSRVGGRSAG